MRNPVRTLVRRRRRRGSNYPNELSGIIEHLVQQKTRDIGSWKAKSTKSFRQCLAQVVNDDQFWLDVDGLMAAAKKLNSPIVY